MAASDDFDVSGQTLGFAILDVYSGVLNILIAIYFAVKLKHLLQEMNQPQHKVFRNSVIWGYVSMILSIFLSMAKMFMKIEILFFQTNFVVPTFDCNVHGCLYCIVCQRFLTIFLLARNCCVMLVFLQTIDSHFESKYSTTPESLERHNKIYKIIKAILVTSQFIMCILAAIFAKSSIHRLSDTPYVACFRPGPSHPVYSPIMAINGVVIVLILIVIVLIFLKHSRQVKSKMKTFYHLVFVVFFLIFEIIFLDRCCKLLNYIIYMLHSYNIGIMNGISNY